MTNFDRSPVRRVPTPEEIAERTAKNDMMVRFLESQSLYTPMNFVGGWDFPGRISLYCDRCGKETTWGVYTGATENEVCCDAQYGCNLCNQTTIRYFVYNDQTKKQVFKIGQYPEPLIEIPKQLKNSLKDSAQHFRRGLVCLKQGYGIAAVAYFRRVVEERTDEMIDVVADLAAANGASADDVAKIRTAKQERNYQNKLQVASDLIPSSLRPGNVNPLGRLHSLLSEALHSLPEAESIKIAEELEYLVGYVFTNLRDYLDAQKDYASRIRSAGNSPAAAK